MSGVTPSDLACDARVWALPKRQNKMADIILDRQKLSSGRWPLSRGIHLLQAIAKEQIIFFSRSFVLFNFPPSHKYLY